MFKKYKSPLVRWKTFTDFNFKKKNVFFIFSGFLKWEYKDLKKI